ncbi:cytosine-specific methyltransferase [Mycoplasmopsis columbina SF7]|uniref:Cytosine-specific methyltransferase n=1 Tax=Mycoplasmopsis columbina SF7 TaxID=1037410 RepID=F9UJ69_9BACT|nr:DNA (cytosine-5-)-methyltransferase [Mycoplasmopsis columbina]EGV00565.1 cytosine-specific methyltransferase [Mycoplasmopsis columbina SF7]
MPKFLKVFETFAGIGAQHKSIKYVNSQNKDVNLKIVATSEWDARSIITYAAIHNQLHKENIEKILNKKNLNEEKNLNNYLKDKIFSLDSKYHSKGIISKSLEFKKTLTAANILNNNLSDITKIKSSILDDLDIDLITYSFPCQGLSVANMGRDSGILNDKSTSHLIWEIGRLLSNSNKKPKYLLLENVKALVGKYSKEYDKWKTFLKSLGYKTFTAVLNAKNHGSLQRRERVFALSTLKHIPTPFKNDKEYENYINNIGLKSKLKNIREQEKKYRNIFDLNNTLELEAKNAAIRNTKSRHKMIELGKCLNDINLAKTKEFTINTLTTRQDRFPNAGYINYETNDERYLNHRFITPREAFKIMGFENSDFDKLNYFIKREILTKTSLYRFAGNSIDVNVLKSVFKTIQDVEINLMKEKIKNDKKWQNNKK